MTFPAAWWVTNMSGIRPSDNTVRESGRQPETGRARPAGDDATRPVEEAAAARFARLLRHGQHPDERDADQERSGRGERDPRLRPELDGFEERPGPAAEREDPRRGGSGRGDEQQPDQSGAAPQGFRGDDILAGLGGARPPTSSDHEIRNRELSGLVGGIVDRVLIGNRDGAPELRVTLKGELFGDSELLISRRDGGIEVTIGAASAAAVDFLARRGDELAGQLAQRLATRVVVQIAPPASAEQSSAGDDRQDRRSRGLEALLTYVAG
jgi:hypothetical protein